MQGSQHGFLVFLGAVIATALASFQAPVNSLLASRIGVIQANFFSNIIGTLALAVAMLIAQPASFGPGFWARSLSNLPPLLWTGGLLGSLYMVTSTLAVKHLGALGWVGAAFIGQVLGGTIVDHFGLFGLTQVPLVPRRLVGIALLVAGAYLTITHK